MYLRIIKLAKCKCFYDWSLHWHRVRKFELLASCLPETARGRIKVIVTSIAGKIAWRISRAASCLILIPESQTIRIILVFVHHERKPGGVSRSSLLKHGNHRLRHHLKMQNYSKSCCQLWNQLMSLGIQLPHWWSRCCCQNKCLLYFQWYPVKRSSKILWFSYISRNPVSEPAVEQNQDFGVVTQSCGLKDLRYHNSGSMKLGSFPEIGSFQEMGVVTGALSESLTASARLVYLLRVTI